MKNLFKTANNNHYLYRPQENKVMFLHPLIYFFSGMEDRNENIQQWLANQEGAAVDIKDLGTFAQKELLYYFKKYRFLKEKNYFRTGNDEPQFQRRLTGPEIEKLVSWNKEVIFEVTKACNLACRYCIQSDLYHMHETDQKVNIDTAKAKLLIKYLHQHWRRSTSPGLIGIKFYGGEPLVNIEAIQEIVAYAKTLIDNSGKFYFKITTNGVLLDKYLDYLIADNFYISISLDGGKDNNSNRVFSNGEPAFEKVTANINLIRDNHPSYFEKNVSFQSVLHNCNSITDIHNYFQETYQKRPLMTEMTAVKVNRARQQDFDKFQKSIYDSLYHGEDYPLLKEKKLDELPQTPGRGIITHHAYNWLLKYLNEPGRTDKNKTPTGTCHPFSRGIFMTTDGKIMPCERIEHKHALGYIDDEVQLDFDAIAERFNHYYDKMNRLCLSCSYAAHCGRCMFNCNVEQPQPDCSRHCGQKEFLQKLSGSIAYMEDNPEIYYKHITEI